MVVNGTSVTVVSKKPVNEGYQINVKLVAIAEVTEILLPVLSTDSGADGVLTPVAYQQLAG